MKHRKLEHEMNVTPSAHALTGEGIFGKEHCWFIHEEQEVMIEAEKLITKGKYKFWFCYLYKTGQSQVR